MLGGIDPIIIFRFKKLAPTLGAQIAKIPLVSKDSTLVLMPPIPIYLSEQLTGLLIDSEDKNVDIETDIETKSDGTEPDAHQKGIASTVTVNIQANKESLGVTLISAMIDLVFDKSTSKEYSIDYLHGATTLFGAVLHTFQVSQNAERDLLTIKIELSKGNKAPVKVQTVPEVKPTVGAVPIADATKVVSQ